MTVVFQRMPDSSGDYDAQKRVHKWCLTGAVGVAADLWVFDEATSLNYALSNIPYYLSSEALYRQNVVPSTPGGLLWYFDVEYGPVPKGIAEWRFTADTTGGTAKLKNSKQCVSAYTVANPGPAGDTALKSTVIGERGDGAIEGADVVIPTQKRTYTVKFAKGVITEAWFDYMENLVGVTNSTVWHNRPIGEVKFLGVKGSSGLNYAAECDIAFDFAFGKNVSNKTFGTASVDEITNVSYKAHELVDVVFEDEADDPAKPGKKIKLIRIHRVHESLNFYTYLGF